MIAHVYKPRRHKDGKLVVSRLYRARIRLQGDSVVTEVPLETSDKQVAEKKLAQLVSERERERAGLIAPRLQRDSAQKPILGHLADFVADLETLGRCEHYRSHILQRVSRMVQDCAWKFPGDISIDGFVEWRSRQTDLGPKTLNEYLNALNVLLNWMERQGRIAENPIRKASRVDTRGRQQRRRAFTDEELNRLLAVAKPDMRLLYLAAAFTGLRIGELQAIVWGDVLLEHVRPHIVVRAITAKNRKEASVPLHPQLIEELRAIRSPEIASNVRVFSQHPHPDRRIRSDIETAGIERMDAMGRKLDFHALRYTFATKLAISGVSQRLAQELLRHSDPRLTANIYTDVTRLPTFEAVNALAWQDRVAGNSVGQAGVAQNTQIAPQEQDAGCPNSAYFAHNGVSSKPPHIAEVEGRGRLLASCGVEGQSLEVGGVESHTQNQRSRSSSGIAGDGGDGFARVAPQQTGIVCSVLSRVVRNWRRVPNSIRTAIDAIIAPYVSEVSCGDYLGRLGVMPLLKFLAAPASEGRAS